MSVPRTKGSLSATWWNLALTKSNLDHVEIEAQTMHKFSPMERDRPAVHHVCGRHGVYNDHKQANSTLLLPGLAAVETEFTRMVN